MYDGFECLNVHSCPKVDIHRVSANQRWEGFTDPGCKFLADHFTVVRRCFEHFDLMVGFLEWLGMVDVKDIN